MRDEERSLGVIDGREPGEKLELICRETGSGALEVELRLLAWGDGVGWYPQRTLPLPSKLAQLRALLRRAEAASWRGAAPGASTDVLQFPPARAADLATPASA